MLTAVSILVTVFKRYWMTLCMLLLLAIPLVYTQVKRIQSDMIVETMRQMRIVNVVSKRRVGRTERKRNEVPNPTVPGTIARNECNTHADTCCAGAN